MTFNADMMNTTASIEKANAAAENTAAGTAAKASRRISWETFRKKYLTREDGYTYEWNNGIIEKSRNSMEPNQLYIQFNLQEIFMQLKVAKKVTGQLLAETDLFFFPDVHKRPDFAWLTQEQTARLSEKGVIEIPAFVIEVVSGNDLAQKLADKMIVYREAGVQVVWQIFPNQQEVHVYAGPKLENMTVCAGEKICSAAPALPGFVFPVNAVFKKEMV
ncbi:MAG: Uma2 family endonuclease [Thermoanaerobaculia bacterium]|nr:Uma2 family endonuclease [Thermoanaerobaculia bacterium]